MTSKLFTMNRDGSPAFRLLNGSTTRLDLTTGPASEFVLLDRSGSMSGHKFEQARDGTIDHAATAIQQGYQVGLIAFGDTSIIASTLSRDLPALRAATQQLRTETCTVLAPALTLAIDALIRERGTRVITVFTDGAVYDKSNSLDEARRAGNQGIHILTIGTHDADLVFLKQLQTVGTLVIPAAGQLQAGIASAAKMLPAPKRGAK